MIYRCPPQKDIEQWPTVWLDLLKLPSTPAPPKKNEPGVLSLGPKISLASLASSSTNRCCRNALGPAMVPVRGFHHYIKLVMTQANLSHQYIMKFQNWLWCIMLLKDSVLIPSPAKIFLDLTQFQSVPVIKCDNLWQHLSKGVTP